MAVLVQSCINFMTVITSMFLILCTGFLVLGYVLMEYLFAEIGIFLGILITLLNIANFIMFTQFKVDAALEMSQEPNDRSPLLPEHNNSNKNQSRTKNVRRESDDAYNDSLVEDNNSRGIKENDLNNPVDDYVPQSRQGSTKMNTNSENGYVNDEGPFPDYLHNEVQRERNVWDDDSCSDSSQDSTAWENANEKNQEESMECDMCENNHQHYKPNNADRPQKVSRNIRNENQCSVCQGNNDGSVTLEPCGHTVLCRQCADNMFENNKKCPECGAVIADVICDF